MINLLKSEVLKIRSTQVWVWMLLLVVALTTLFTLGTVLSIQTGTPKEGINYFSVWTTFGTAGIALLVLGLLGLTTEFRHQTITPTLLATPDRWRLLSGKALAYVIFAIPYGLICIVVNLVVATICLKAKSFPVTFADGAIGGIVTNFISLILLAFFGLGLGALIRNQAAGMVAGILYLSIINGLLSVIPVIRKVYLFEPGGALTAFTTRDRDNYGLRHDVIHVSPMLGGLILLVWCVAILIAGGYFSLQRDIS